MDIKKLLGVISDDECIVLTNDIGNAVIDNDDIIDNIGGIEHVFIRYGPNENDVLPVPAHSFKKATIMTKANFGIESMMELIK